jgi:hypothetical protein
MNWAHFSMFRVYEHMVRVLILIIILGWRCCKCSGDERECRDTSFIAAYKCKIYFASLGIEKFWSSGAEIINAWHQTPLLVLHDRIILTSFACCPCNVHSLLTSPRVIRNIQYYPYTAGGLYARLSTIVILGHHQPYTWYSLPHPCYSPRHH